MSDSVRNRPAPKPLGQRNYGSIPHLSGSRLGPSDRRANPGQEEILTFSSRGRRIILTEKLDGSNMGVARIGDEIIALNRADYEANTSPYEFQRCFTHWVKKREDLFRSLLEDGERVVGEWMLLAHGTRYRIETEDSLFVAFDIMTKSQRHSYDIFKERCMAHGLTVAPLLSDGEARSIHEALAMLGDSGFSGALDKPEGVVWRAEHKSKCEFLAKYVYADKVDGCFLPEVAGCDPIWNYSPERLLAA